MRRIALLSLFTAIALILSLVDNALPPLLPIPGVRLGLANVVTLILLFAVRSRDAFLVLIGEKLPATCQKGGCRHTGRHQANRIANGNGKDTSSHDTVQLGL